MIFVVWGFYFLFGVDGVVFGKVVMVVLIGMIGVLFMMWFGLMLVDLLDFWGLGVMIGIIVAGFVVLFMMVEIDCFVLVFVFCCYVLVFFWWIVIGLDNFVLDGKGLCMVEVFIVVIINKLLLVGMGVFGGLLLMLW